MKRLVYASSSLREDLFEELLDDGIFTSRYELNKALDIDWTDVTPEDSAEFLRSDWFNPKAIYKVEYVDPEYLEDTSHDVGYKVTGADGVSYWGFVAGNPNPDKLHVDD